MAAAVDLLGDLDARVAATHVESADALGAVDLVAGDGHDVDVVGDDVDGDLADGLDGVAVEEHALLVAELADLLHGLDDADLVVCVHDADENGLVVHGALEVFDVDEAVGLDREVGDAVALLLKLLAGVERGLVLGDLGDDVVAALLVHLGDALDGEVGGFGGSGGEDDLLGGSTDELGDLLAGLLDALLGFPAEGVVAAGGVAEDAGEVGHHGLKHARVERGGGVVVHVDGQVDALGKGLAGLCDVDAESFCHGVLLKSVRGSGEADPCACGRRMTNDEDLARDSDQSASQRVIRWVVSVLDEVRDMELREQAGDAVVHLA